MLSDDAIDKLVDKFVQRQENLNNYVIGIIAERLKEIGTLTPSDIYKLEQLIKGGADVRKINAEISRITNLQVTEIQSIIRSVALSGYTYARPLYDYTQAHYIPFNKNKELQKVVNAVARQTSNTYTNISKAQAFMLRDPRNPKRLIPTSVSKTYYTIIDQAIHSVKSNAVDYNTVIKNSIEQLVNSGLRSVTYQAESGRIHSQRIDTAARRNILDGIRAINQGTQDVIGEQIGADGKEITVHANSAPDHEPIQGHQFTNEEFERLQNQQSFTDYTGIHFEPIQRPIGVWNCRHFTYSIILGISKPNFTLKQLERYKQNNAKGYTLPSGKHLTMYECTQRQRAYETNIRRAKDLYIAAEKAGNTSVMQSSRARVNQLMKEYYSFSNACGLKPKINKIRVSGYK